MTDTTNADENALRKAWMERAEGATFETLPGLLRDLAGHEHTYSSIVLAVAAAALAAAKVMDRSEHGGITGFQASIVMWEFMRAWMQWPEDGVGRVLLDYDYLLFPQYEDRFTTISAEVWAEVQKKAAKRLEEPMHPEVRAHHESIVAGKVPFGLKVRA